MFETDYPVLCGGTFFTLVLLASKPGTSSRNHVNGEKNSFREKDILEALAKIVIPELEKDILPSGCSEFKSCKKRLFAVAGISPRSEYREAFDERVKTQYTSVLDAMEKFVEKYISTDNDKQTRCARRLLDLICKDESIQQSEIFYTSEHRQALKEVALIEDELDIYLPALLLSIWHFVVVHRAENERGKKTFLNWHEKSSSNSKWEFISEIGNDYNGKIRILPKLPKRFEDSVDFYPPESDADDNTSQSGAAEIAVPQGCRICLCCKDWLGNMGCAVLSLSGTYGECDAHGKRMLSTGGCDQFREDYGKISQYQMYSKIPRIWKK